ncbi:hypothetical protein [Kitasatospora phosalacinea]|uniref:hypothetical protein n=1 Tax=Kitasatospora phosalacinea TaxID=2065 RepID=UPI00131D30AB|nr:hypothetical protein [Kitasatospora phosalacinea]
MEELLNVTSDSLIRFLTRWYGEPDLPAAVDLSVVNEMPIPLRTWHEITSRWSAGVTSFNYPVGPHELELEDGKLVFWVENQGCWTWATSPDGDDPLVFDRQSSADPDPWTSTGETLSEFLLQATVFEAILGATNLWSAENVTGDQLSQILTGFRPLPLPNWRWPAPDVRILVGRDLLAEASVSMNSDPATERPSFDVSIAAPSPELLAHLANVPDVAWRVRPAASSHGGSAVEPIPDFLR